MKSVELYIARRYLTSKRKVRFINVIGYISIIGITAGVAALLIALSVFNGFNGVVTSVLVGFDPHLRIEKRGSITEAEYTRVGNLLKDHSEIAAFSPFISGKAMLAARSSNRVVFVRGIDEKRIAGVSGLKDKIVLGSLSMEDAGGLPGIIIGITLADRLAAVTGSEIIVYSPYGMQNAVAGMGMPESERFRVAGIFESNNRDYDADYAYISLQAAQHLFNLAGKSSGIEMRLKDFNASEKVKKELLKELPEGFIISTWYDLHQNLYSVMQIERWSAYILLCLIILVAALNMLGSLTMGVIEKHRDISVLKAMGMTSGGIVRVFMVEGLIIGVIGTLLGIIIGLIVLYLQVRYQIFPLDTTVYIIPAIPVEIRWTDFVAIALASMGLSFLAAYYPARRAASTLPAEGLRWE